MEFGMELSAVRLLRKQLRVIEREVERQLKSQTLCCGVTSAQCHVLLELAEGGASSLVELSERLKLDTSTLSRTVDSLVRAGHVTRITDPANRRYVLVGLTRKGRQKVEFIDRESDRFSSCTLVESSKWQPRTSFMPHQNITTPRHCWRQCRSRIHRSAASASSSRATFRIRSDRLPDAISIRAARMHRSVACVKPR
jgi:DNA-binding MarR family transcriptional regulator